MKAQRYTPLMVRLFKKLGRRVGATSHIEKDWGYVIQMKNKSGRMHYGFVATNNINPAGSTALAKDKDYAAYFMRRLGYSTVPGKTFYSNFWSRAIHSSDNLEAACAYAKKIGYPVIAKPNRGAMGEKVFLAKNETKLRHALRQIFCGHKVAIIQPLIPGQDYRIVVLDGKVRAAYRRTPLHVIGTGRSTIETLLTKKLQKVVVEGEETRVHISDERIAHKLTQSRLSLRSVPKKGECVFLMDNANLSAGGSAEDVADILHPYFKKIAIQVTKDMGLRFCGVDMLIDGDCSKKTSSYAILEINASPGLRHYSNLGKKQRQNVESLYLEILKKLAA